MDPLYILLAIFLLVSFLASGSEIGFYCLNRIRLRYREEKGWWTARVVSQLLADPQRLVITILVANNVANYVVTIIFTSIMEKNVPHVEAELLTTVILSPFLLVFCEILPKNIFHAHADSIIYKVGGSYTYFLSKLFLPLVVLLRLVNKVPGVLLKGVEARQSPFFSPQRLSYFLEEGTAGGALSMYQNIMARNIMAMGQTPLKKVMIPLEEAAMAPDAIGPQTLKDLAREKKFSRIPIYERERSKVVGIVTLLEFLREGVPSVKPFIRPATYLDANLPVDDALLRLRHARQRMGIVTDGDGNAVGIVTIKDLVEEIVGELSVW